MADLAFAPGSAPQTDDSWVIHSICKGQTHLFFPPPGERPEARVRREAKAKLICGKCPVLEPCREYARQEREHGVWGGENEEERAAAGFRAIAPIGLRSRRKQA